MMDDKVSVSERDVFVCVVKPPNERTVMILASPEKGVLIPGYDKPVKGSLLTRDLTVGISIIPPGGGLSPHSHKYSEEIIYVLSGKGEYVIGDKRIRIEPGTSLLIPPGIKHKATNDSNESLKQIWSVTEF